MYRNQVVTFGARPEGHLVIGNQKHRHRNALFPTHPLVERHPFRQSGIGQIVLVCAGYLRSFLSLFDNTIIN